MFKINEKVFIPKLRKSGVIKEIESDKYKVTYFDNNQRKVEWFSFNDIRKFKKKDVLLIAKVKPNAIIPTKRYEDGCYDIYACFDEDYIMIKPGEIKMIPTGIATSFSPKYRFEVRERGSSGTKGLARRSGQIDSGYRDEWFIPINNTTSKDIIITKQVQEIKKYDDRIEYPFSKAIAQVALEFVPDVITKEISYEKLKEIPSERGTGKLGDSGK